MEDIQIYKDLQRRPTAAELVVEECGRPLCVGGLKDPLEALRVVSRVSLYQEAKESVLEG